MAPRTIPLRALLARCEALGVRLWAESGRLRYDAPGGVLDDDLRTQLAGARSTLLAACLWAELEPLRWGKPGGDTDAELADERAAIRAEATGEPL